MPAGREGAPSVLFSACKNEKYHPGSNPSGYKQWFRRLRAAFRPSVLKEGGITAERLEGADILVLGAPREKFSVAKFGGGRFHPRRGSLLVLADEGGEGSPGHQHQLSHRGIRHQYQQRQSGAHGAPEVFPPEGDARDGMECSPSRQQFGGGRRSKRAGPLRIRPGEQERERESDDSMDSPKFMSGRKAEDGMTFIVMPYAAAQRRSPQCRLSSGKICYPNAQPLAALWRGNKARGEGDGRVAVLGSGTMADDEWLDREDNAKIMDFVLRWLCPAPAD